MHCFCKARFIRDKNLESMDVKFDEFKPLDEKGPGDKN